MGKIKARGQFHQIKNEDTGASSMDSQDYTYHTVKNPEIYIKNFTQLIFPKFPSGHLK